MERDTAVYRTYLAILREELVQALGCTEPIALAFASARARQLLGELPDQIEVRASGNIIKNVKGVVVPASGGLRGMEAAAVLGAVGGCADKALEVLSTVTQADIETARELLRQKICAVRLLDTKAKLHLIVTARKRGQYATVELVHSHLGIVRLERNGELLLSKPFAEECLDSTQTDRGCLSVAGIYEFAQSAAFEDLYAALHAQVACNTAISREGLARPYGMKVGRTLLALYGDGVRTRAKAAAAAGSDARMSGCDMPVVINSGSGNQGLTVSLPVIEYARELGVTEENMYRALALSNLAAIHQKTRIGRLSAYCGAVSAAAGAGAGITYLSGGGVKEISDTITNTLANVAGIVCDGAKPSCAAKIATSLDAALFAHGLAMKNRRFGAGEGIVQECVEDTITKVAQMAREGMQRTDEEILKIMSQ